MSPITLFIAMMDHTQYDRLSPRVIWKLLDILEVFYQCINGKLLVICLQID